MNQKTKSMVDSYLRNLAGQLVTAVTIVMGTSGLSPLDFALGEWLYVSLALVGPVIPTGIRWLNKQDPAFGKIAELVVVQATNKVAATAKSTARSTSSAPAKKPVVAPVKTTKPRTGNGGGGKGPIAR